MIIHVLSLLRLLTRDKPRRDGLPGTKGNAITVAGQVAASAVAPHAVTPLAGEEGERRPTQPKAGKPNTGRARLAKE